MRRTLHVASLVALVGICFTLAACQPQAQTPAAAPAAPDYAAQYGAAVDAFYAAWDSKDYARLDGVVGATFARRAPDQNTDSLAAQKTFMQQVHTVYPDFHLVRNVDTFGKDVAFTQWTVTGTFTAEGAEPKKIAVEGATLLRFSGGKIVEEVAFYDTAGLLAQTAQTAVPHAAAK